MTPLAGFICSVTFTIVGLWLHELRIKALIRGKMSRMAEKALEEQVKTFLLRSVPSKVHNEVVHRFEHQERNLEL